MGEMRAEREWLRGKREEQIFLTIIAKVLEIEEGLSQLKDKLNVELDSRRNEEQRRASSAVRSAGGPENSAAKARKGGA